MSTRLAQGGRLIDRSRKVSFSFNGKRLSGYDGDTLASALLGAGQTLLGRSFKYHRPRGVVASGPEEPNALMNVGANGYFEPNQRATVTPLYDGLEAQSQNHWPSLEIDIGAANQLVARALPAGFYYKTFIHPRPFWKHVFEPIIRQSAGLGKAPKDRDGDTYEHFYFFCDVVVVGGGIAGLQAALTAGRSGARVLLLEQSGNWGGRAPVDGASINGDPAATWIAATVETLASLPNVTLRLNTQGSGVYDHGYLLANEQIADHTPGDERPRGRLWRIRTKKIITTTGAIERPLSFAGNDLPGVMLASAVRDFVENYGVSPGDRTVVVTNNDDAYRTALCLHRVGLAVPIILDARPEGGGALADEARAAGLRVEHAKAIASVKGGRKVEAVEVCLQAGEGAVLETVECDAVAMSGGWSPAVHLYSHCGGKLIWDDALALFRPDPTRPPITHDGSQSVYAAGSANGHFGTASILENATNEVKAVVEALGLESSEFSVPAAEDAPEAAIASVWLMPQGAGVKLRSKTWLDFQNDVKVSDVQLAAREGYESVEHAKRYTTLGMATDQGKLSNINGLATLSAELGKEIPQVGTTTFRPPYTPIPMGTIAGEARDDLFQPVRKTRMHGWHEAHGAYWEPVGQWRRPYCFQKQGESIEDAVHREVVATREGVGLLDASTLGKILVSGPDAGKFLDMLYTNMMSTLKPGRCRYGLMCTENGFLTDDGVVARIDEDSFLCHTTTGGADRIHAHMEEWLQTEWWDWKVWTVNLTEQYAQIGVVGPYARALLDKVGGMDLSVQSLPFMSWVDGELAGIAARIFRISFSGELSFEIAVPAARGLELWERLVSDGAEWNATPYGTEALHIMRAEKGFIMIGDETDGTVIPQDLGLNWAISKKKADYIGKRAQERGHMTNPTRWQLVGLQTEDGSVIPDGAYAVGEGVNANGQRRVIGRVTSTYFSPTLGRGIAMGLVEDGPDRMGDILNFPKVTGEAVAARIVSPVFLDPEGEKQNA